MQLYDPDSARQVVVRYPAQPSNHGPIGAVFHMPSPLQAVAELVRRIGVAPERLEAMAIEAGGERLAVINLNLEAPQLSRVAAFVLEGLSLIEVKLALSFLREATVEKRA